MCVIKDGSNAMRLVKGVWKKGSHNWELNHRPLTSRVSVLPLHHCDSLVHTPLYCAGGTEVPQSQHLAPGVCYCCFGSLDRVDVAV